MLDVEKAREELKTKSMAEIERATAMTWGARAVASYRLASEAKGLGERFRHFYEGENYRQEALEHASMAEDRGKLFLGIHEEVEKDRRSALDVLGSIRSRP